jgi:class I fructose-bisphosphate aldolase
VKLPTAHLEQPEAKKAYETNRVALEPQSARVAHIVQSCFDGRRIVIFSGGAKVSDEKLLDEVRAIKAGGGFGSIIGRNSFQRSRAEAIKLLGTIMDIYAGTSAR